MKKFLLVLLLLIMFTLSGCEDEVYYTQEEVDALIEERLQEYVLLETNQQWARDVEKKLGELNKTQRIVQDIHKGEIE